MLQPGDIAHYLEGKNCPTYGKVVAVTEKPGGVSYSVQSAGHVHIVDSSRLIENELLTRSSSKPGQMIRLLRRDGQEYVGTLTSWGVLYIKIRVAEGEVGYMCPIDDLYAVYPIGAK